MKMRHRPKVRRQPYAACFKGAPRRGKRTEPIVLMVEPDYGADWLAALKGDSSQQADPSVPLLRGYVSRW